MNNKYDKEVNYTACWRADKHHADKRKKETRSVGVECGRRVAGSNTVVRTVFLEKVTYEQCHEGSVD